MPMGSPRVRCRECARVGRVVQSLRTVGGRRVSPARFPTATPWFWLTVWVHRSGAQTTGVGAAGGGRRWCRVRRARRYRRGAGRSASVACLTRATERVAKIQDLTLIPVTGAMSWLG